MRPALTMTNLGSLVMQALSTVQTMTSTASDVKNAETATPAWL
jgi:hypothetical protein